MLLPSPIVNAPFGLPFNIRGDDSTSTTFDVLDDSFPIVEGVPTNYYLELEELSKEALPSIFTAAYQLTMTADLVSVSGYTSMLPLT